MTTDEIETKNVESCLEKIFGNFVDEVSHLNFPKIPPEQTFNWRVDIKL